MRKRENGGSERQNVHMKRTVWMTSTAKSARQSGVNVRARTASKCTSDGDAAARGDTLSHSKSGVAPIAVTGVPLGRRRRISPSWWGILRTCAGAHRTRMSTARKRYLCRATDAHAHGRVQLGHDPPGRGHRGVLLQRALQCGHQLPVACVLNRVRHSLQRTHKRRVSAGQ